MEGSIVLELWNHGLAGSPSTPCGEVDILKVSGNNISSDLLEMLLEQGGEHKNDWFGSLPTEETIIVLANWFFDDDFWVEVVSFELMDCGLGGGDNDS